MPIDPRILGGFGNALKRLAKQGMSVDDKVHIGAHIYAVCVHASLQSALRTFYFEHET